MAQTPVEKLQAELLEPSAEVATVTKSSIPTSGRVKWIRAVASTADDRSRASRLTPPVGDASARVVATTRGRRHHTEIANLYNTSVYLSMQGPAATVTPY